MRLGENYMRTPKRWSSVLLTCVLMIPTYFDDSNSLLPVFHASSGASLFLLSIRTGALVEQSCSRISFFHHVAWDLVKERERERQTQREKERERESV